MKRIRTILLFFLIAGGILTGCDAQRTERGPEQTIPADEKESDGARNEVPAKILDLSVKTVYIDKNIGEEHFSVEYPLYSLAAPSAEDGDRPEEYRELKNTLSAIHTEMREHAENLQANFEQAVSARQSLSYYREGFVTRADTKIVSFYERSRQYEGQDFELKKTGIKTHTIDASTGKELGFSDVFRDTKSLAHQIAEAVKKAYRRQEFHPDMEALIRRSIENNDGGICFALGYGEIYIFAAEYLLSDEPGGHRITLPYTSDSSEIKPFYTKAPAEYMLPMDYDMNYFPEGLPGGFSMHFSEDEEEMEYIWSLRMGDSEVPVYEESFYGYAPHCTFLRSGEKNYLYVLLPSGDASITSNIYQLTNQKVTFLDQIPLGIFPETILNPNRIRMSLGRYIYTEAIILSLQGTYRIGKDGKPEPVSNIYDLSGKESILKQNCRVEEVDRKDPALSKGNLDLPAGTVLRPYRTDGKSWIDFITKEGRICRFRIDVFSEEMQFEGFGSPENLFEIHL